MGCGLSRIRRRLQQLHPDLRVHLAPDAEVGVELHPQVGQLHPWSCGRVCLQHDSTRHARAAATALQVGDELVDPLGVANVDFHLPQCGIACCRLPIVRLSAKKFNPSAQVIEVQTWPVRAMVLDFPGRPLRPADLPEPEPAPSELLLRILACGVCRTDLHIVDGELTRPKLPLVLGHQIVGEVVGDGRRVGVPWLGWTCGECKYCRSGLENLCDFARFTGYDRDGGFAEYVVTDERYCLPLPEDYTDVEAAPLLCAGLIGYRALRFAGDAESLGLYGFGASAHIVAQVAGHQGRRVYAFTRPGDAEGQAFARELGVEWAGGSDKSPPEELDAAIIFAPVGALVPAALRAVRKAGSVVCAGIHMSDIPAFQYELLWGERSVRSVANLTRSDGEEFLALAPQVPVRTEVTTYGLERRTKRWKDYVAASFAARRF